MSPSSCARRVATALLLGTTLAVGGVVGPARAHSETGIMEIVTLESPSPLEIRIEVGIVYANDDDPAADATVSVLAISPDGATAGPIDVPNVDDGLYETTFAVPAPGSWSIAATSTDPAAEATGNVEVTSGGATTSAPASTTTAGDTTTTVSGSSATTVAAPTTDEPAATVATDAPADSAGGDDDGEGDEEGGTDVAPLLLLAVLALATIGVVVYLARRSRGEPPAAGGDDATGRAGDDPTDDPGPGDASGSHGGDGGYDSGSLDGGGD